MPRCTMTVPVSKPSRMYFARRSTRRTISPWILASKPRGMGQRRRRSRTLTAATRRPKRAGAMPRHVVSTSGSSGSRRLLDLGFFVSDVLAHDRIVFLGLHLVGMQTLGLRRRVIVPGAGRRDQFDFIAHERVSPWSLCPLNFDALGAQIRNDHVDAALFDRTQAARRDTQAHETLLGLQPKAMRVQIRQEAAPLAIVCMRNRISRFRALTRDLADS